MKTHFLFGGLAVFCLQSAFAEKTQELDPVVVTATRLATPIKTTLPHTTLIDSEDIRNSGAKDLTTLLRAEAGLEIAQDGGLGQRSSAFSRGTNSSHTLVLIDGIPINSATAGGAALDQIMLDQVDRVEIARGNLSSLYGSQAIGGVIQVFTKGAKSGSGGAVSVGYGSYQTARTAASYRYGTETLQLGIAASALTSDGYSAINEQDVKSMPFPERDQDRDGYRNLSVSAHGKYSYAKGQSVSVTAFHSDGRTKFDDLFLSNNSSKPKLTSGSLAFENTIGSIWNSHVRIGTALDDSKFFNDGVETSHFKTVNEKIEWQNDFKVFNDDKVILGVDYLRQRVDYDDGFGGVIDKSRDDTAAFAGYVARFHGGHHLQVNVRQDRYSDVGSRTTWLLGGGFGITDQFSVTGMVSTAFRAPTFVDLYYPFSGNPDLKPERARSTELGLQYAGSLGIAKVVYFRNRLKDLIGFANFKSVNINRAKSDGLEASIDAGFGDTTMRASVTFQNPTDETTGQRLLRRAKKFASISVSHQFQRWNMGGEIVASGSKLDGRVDDFSPVTVPGYVLFNLKSSYNISDNVRINARLDNLFDKRYQLVHGYNRERRSGYVDITYDF